MASSPSRSGLGNRFCNLNSLQIEGCATVVRQWWRCHGGGESASRAANLSGVATDTKRPTGAKCKAKNRRGERCGGLAGSDGLCSAHRDPGRMKELGSRGGRARRKGVAEQLPEAERQSLRQALAKVRRLECPAAGV